MEDWRSEDDEVSREVWKAVETEKGKTRVTKIKEEEKKEKERKRREEKKQKKEERRKNPRIKGQ